MYVPQRVGQNDHGVVLTIFSTEINSGLHGKMFKVVKHLMSMTRPFHDRGILG